MVGDVTRKGRTILNAELDSMNMELIEIGQRVKMAILKIEKALDDYDDVLASEVIIEDEDINNLCIDLEKHAYRVIALQQPISSDLRQIVCTIRTVPDLERMGDHVKAIAKVIPDMRELSGIYEIKNLMVDALNIIGERLDRAIELFIEKDSIDAIEISKGDDDIDEKSNYIIKKIIKEMKEDIDNINKVSKILLLAKSIERMGDYIVNICENTVYLNTGELIELM